MDVVDIGVVATPMVYFATHHFNTGSGVMVTGSHNPPEYNGLKMMIAGETLAAEAIQDLRRLVESLAPGRAAARESLVTPAVAARQRAGVQSTADIAEAYLSRIVFRCEASRAR